MTTLPKKPSALSLWMDKHGRPNRITVDYVQTGTDTAETRITFAATQNRKPAAITVGREAFGNDRWSRAHDVILTIDHATVLDWTDDGRKQLEEWKRFNKAEARDLAEFERLKKKFGDGKSE